MRATLTPWLWIGRTKEVRTHVDMDDPVGHRRFAAIEGRVYITAMQNMIQTFC